VGNILAKLGLASRAEVAAFVVRRGVGGTVREPPAQFGRPPPLHRGRSRDPDPGR
jgi:hypothetical protein